MRHDFRVVASSFVALMLPFGCAPSVPEGNPLPDPVATTADPAEADFNGKISDVINKVSDKYRALEYDYNEDLLRILDRVDARLAGESAKLDPLPFSKLDEAEQLDHFRETIKRWSAKTGKTLRVELDSLLADVAARKAGGPVFHPEFQKKFSAAFDEFIPIEVAELRERRNRALHEAAKPLLQTYRDKAPNAVKEAESTLNAAPYNLSSPSPAG